jgi:thioesterase domain-containing protein/acyl carrier protein
LDEQRQPVPVGSEGELHIGGAGLARGYLNRPELTAEHFIPHPLSETPGARLYKTGDLVRRLPDEKLEFLGRLDYQVKLRGFRIELGEIETTLAQHPRVREAVVLLREDRPGKTRIVAYAVPREKPGPMPGELRRFLSTRLPAHMVPSAFLLLERLPLTPNNKVDRRALPVPEAEQAHTNMAPRTPMEESLARIWKEVLGVNSVGIHDDFFELGGDSLLAVELFARIDKAFGSRLPLSTLFQEATIERLADRLTQPQPGTVRPALVEIQKGGTKPPLFLVHPLGGELIIYSQLVRYLGPDQPVYGFQQLAPDGEAQKTHASVESVAATYVEELLAAQSQEPFLLVGYSFGALIALEMARQLTAKGHQVVLAVTDENLPDPDGKSWWSVRPIWRVARDFPHWLRYDFLRRRPRHHYARFLRLMRRAKRKLAKVLGRLPAKSREEEIADLFWVFAMPESLRAFFAANFRMTSDYRPQTYPGAITVFRARSQPFLALHEPDLGWGKIAGGGVTVRVIPGTHDSILTHPHVKVLARELEAVLSGSKGSKRVSC